jgi:hypothetical protein
MELTCKHEVVSLLSIEQLALDKNLGSDSKPFEGECMKKLMMLVVTLMLGAGLAVAQTGSNASSGTTDKPAATKSTKKGAKKSSAKKEKGAKASSDKKADTGSK